MEMLSLQLDKFRGRSALATLDLQACQANSQGPTVTVRGTEKTIGLAEVREPHGLHVPLQFLRRESHCDSAQ